MVSRIGFLTAALLGCALVSGCATGTTGQGGGGATTTSSNTGGGDAGPAAECGNGMVEDGEECDDGNQFPNDGCSSKCTIDNGFSCSGSPSICSAACGDGLLGGGEECDDNNAKDGDGCSAACKVEQGFSCKGAPSTCVTICGDGHMGGEEECDDNNVASGDGCNLSCKVEKGYVCNGMPSQCITVCGDGVIAGNEKCDDGNAVSSDGCDSECQLEEGYDCIGMPTICTSICGDGLKATDEECDDANNASGDGCDALCFKEPGWSCSGTPNKCTPICGDGLLRGGEECDDSNTTPGDGCNNLCKVQYGYTCTGEPSSCKIICGDGVIAGQEFCDDKNAMSLDGCSSACKVEVGYSCTGMPSVCKPICGNGVVSTGEGCDDGNLVPGDGCSPTCQIELGYKCVGAPSFCTTDCGDGKIGGNEQCDDGNTVSGDGCSFGCTIEAGFNCVGNNPSVCTGICGDGIVVKGEQCDDGNSVTGDCCNNCQAEAGCEREYNNTIQTANDIAAIGVSGKIKGVISPTSDFDYYAVTIPPGSSSGSLTAAIQDGPIAGDTCASNKIETRVILYDPNGTQLLQDDGSGPGNCSLLTAPALPPATYYLLVRNAPTSSKSYSYSLQVTTTLSVCGNGTKEPGEQCDDSNTVSGDGCSATCTIEGIPAEVEPNDTFAAADARAADAAPVLFNGPKLLAGSIPTGGDKDLFKVQVATDGAVRFETFDNINPSSCSIASTRLRLFNAQQQLIYTDANSGISSCSALVVYLTAGTYYVQVEGANLTTTIPGYFIEMALPNNGGNEAEPNATLNQANALAGTEMYVFGGHQTASDSDFYAITVPAGASVRAEIIEGNTETCEGLDVDSRVTFYNAAGTQLAEDDDNGRGYCSLLDGTGATPANPPAHALTAGTYYLQVRSSIQPQTPTGGQFDYRLVVTIRP